MNPDAIDLDDTELLNDPEMAGTLKPRRLRHLLSFAEVRKLVERLEIGRKRHANIETCGGGCRGCWRLRFSLRDGKGGIMMYRLELQEKKHRKWLNEDAVGRLTDRMASIMPRNDVVAGK